MLYDRGKAARELHDTGSRPGYAVSERGCDRALEEENMRGRMVVWTAAVVVLALAGLARASQEQQVLDRAGLKKQAAANKALSRYLKYNGYPDVAEVKPIKDQPPWDDHEVTLYYLDMRKEISFARARVLGRPDVYSTRYERVLTDADIRALRTHAERIEAAPSDVASCTGSAVQRAECSAGRAENAAERVELAAVRAEKAADRTEAIVDKMVAQRSTRHAGRHR